VEDPYRTVRGQGIENVSCVVDFYLRDMDAIGAGSESNQGWEIDGLFNVVDFAALSSKPSLLLLVF
jgi:hypothetical protein